MRQTTLQTLERSLREPRELPDPPELLSGLSVNPVSFRILRNPCLVWDRRLPLTGTLLLGRDHSRGELKSINLAFNRDSMQVADSALNRSVHAQQSPIV